LQRGLAAAESVFRMLDEATEVDTGSVTLGRARGEIEFTGVGLRYAGAERDALTGIDVSIRPGETVALVGPSGGGKTSLVNLVPRFYHAGHGQIRIDGHDIETLTLGSPARQYRPMSDRTSFSSMTRSPPTSPMAASVMPVATKSRRPPAPPMRLNSSNAWRRVSTRP
jgi:ABC-type bacteriocin/lantibiotic exporter with double-glycine peptidase domain